MAAYSVVNDNRTCLRLCRSPLMQHALTTLEQKLTPIDLPFIKPQGESFSTSDPSSSVKT
ncbi:unnamed protein product [Clavelina lepadiformis]|uniref:Uncharacterized protein n=1 Tax=Clavelina lepadiformis TaxID=159417 RepID=A0ABP0FV47_CLALP